MSKQVMGFVIIALVAMGCRNTQTAEAPANTQEQQDLPATVATPPAPAEEPAKEAVYEPDIKAERAIQDDYLKSMETAPQYQSVRNGQTGVITGKNGTVLTVVSDDLQTEDGQPVPADIHVELKELAGTEDFIKNGAPTVCDGRMLVSDGAYYVNMTSADKRLALKPGRAMKMRIPRRPDKSTTLFYGEKKADGSINWKPADAASIARMGQERNVAGQKNMQVYETDTMPKSGTMSVQKFRRMVTVRDTGSGTAGVYSQRRCEWTMASAPSEVYDEISVQQLGWINCDRFLNQPTTSFAYTINADDSIVACTAFLIFRDINSVLEHFYKYRQQAVFNNVPVNARATLVVIAVKNGKVLAARSEVTLGTDNNISLSVRPVSDDEVKGMFKKS